MRMSFLLCRANVSVRPNACVTVFGDGGFCGASGGLLAVLLLGALVVREAADGRIFMLQRLEMTGDVQKVPLARLKEAVEPAAAGKTFYG